jgi:hypothetical protein
MNTMASSAMKKSVSQKATLSFTVYSQKVVNGDYTYFVFTQSSASTGIMTVNGNNIDVHVLVVGGGGGGGIGNPQLNNGNFSATGGNGGDVVYGKFTAASCTYDVTIGAGGSPGQSTTAGICSTVPTIGGYTALSMTADIAITVKGGSSGYYNTTSVNNSITSVLRSGFSVANGTYTAKSMYNQASGASSSTNGATGAIGPTLPAPFSSSYSWPIFASAGTGASNNDCQTANPLAGGGFAKNSIFRSPLNAVIGITNLANNTPATGPNFTTNTAGNAASNSGAGGGGGGNVIGSGGYGGSGIVIFAVLTVNCA